MTRRGGEWLANTRAGRTVFRVVTIGMVLGAAYAVIRTEVGRQTDVATRAITRRVTVIEDVSPYDVVRACLRSPSCRNLLVEHPELNPPAAGGKKAGDAFQPGSTGHQQPGPHGGGRHHGSAGGEHPAPEPTADPPAAQPAVPTGSSAGSSSDPPAEPPAKNLPEQVTGKVEEVTDGVKEAAEGAVCEAVPVPGCSR
jgi:hypothetical protein